eukprot:gene660-964_t
MPKASEKSKAASQAAFKRSKANRNAGFWSSYKIWGFSLGGVSLLGALLVLFNPPKSFSDTLVNDSGLIYQIKRSNPGWKAGATPMFEDFTLGDVKRIAFSQVGGAQAQACSAKHTSTKIPTNFDARERWPHCFNTKVYTTGNCSASWATSVAQTFANRVCIADPNNFADLQLSPQNLLSCDHNNEGCDGGNVQNSLVYLMQQGIVPESCMPFRADSSISCSTKCSNKRPVKASGYCVMSNPEDGMREIVMNGPILGVMFMSDDILLYKDGLFKAVPTSRQFLDENKSRMFVGVTVLGYGTEDGRDYWLVENAWGPEWGQNGVAKILRIPGDGREGGGLWQAWMFAPQAPANPGASVVVPGAKKPKSLQFSKAACSNAIKRRRAVYTTKDRQFFGLKRRRRGPCTRASLAGPRHKASFPVSSTVTGLIFIVHAVLSMCSCCTRYKSRQERLSFRSAAARAFQANACISIPPFDSSDDEDDLDLDLEDDDDDEDDDDL